MGWLYALLVPVGTFGLFLEGKMWYPRIRMHGRTLQRGGLEEVDAPDQAGPRRTDPSHYDEHGRYLWWGC